MWRDEAFLLDIVLAGREAQEFTRNVTEEDFCNNRLLQHAVMRLIQIMGEAARNLSPEFKQAHPEVPWLAIVGMRNRLVHEYFRIIPDKVWQVVVKDLPGLIASIEPLVPLQDST